MKSLCDLRQSASEVRVFGECVPRGFGKGRGSGSVGAGVGGSEIGGSGSDIGGLGVGGSGVAGTLGTEGVGIGGEGEFGGTFGGQLCVPEVGDKMSI